MILKRKSMYVMVRSSKRMDFTQGHNASAFLRELERVMGIQSYSISHPKIAKQLSESIFIVKLNRGTESQFILASAFIKKIGGTEMGFQTIKTSGAITNLIHLSTKKGK